MNQRKQRLRLLQSIEKNSAAREGNASNGSPASGLSGEAASAGRDGPAPREYGHDAPALRDAGGDAPALREDREKEATGKRRIRFERGGSAPRIYPDGDVCRLLGKNHTYLVRARKSQGKGRDWDVIEHHAGMTDEWIRKENPAARIEAIEQWRIRPGDGIVSVEVLQHTTDCRKLVCKRLSDEARIVVWVDEASRFKDGDQFDVRELGDAYRWEAALNRHKL